MKYYTQHTYSNTINEDKITKSFYHLIKFGFASTGSDLEFPGLNLSLQFVTKEEWPLLIKEVESVLNGEKEKILFPLDLQYLCEIGSSGMVTKEITRGCGSKWDPESIPTKDFLDILKLYLSEIQKFEKLQT